MLALSSFFCYDMNRESSYFLCHIPLYWDFKQRHSFYDTYYYLRQYDVRRFDQHVSFEDETVIDHGWRSRVDSSLYKCLKVVVKYFDGDINDGYQDKFLLMPFHRSSLEHYKRLVCFLVILSRSILGLPHG